MTINKLLLQTIEINNVGCLMKSFKMCEYSTQNRKVDLGLRACY